MKKSIVILLHISYWLMYLFLFAFYYYISKAATGKNILFDEDLLAILFLTFLTGFISFYIFYFFLVPRYLARKKIFLFIGLGITVSIATALLPTLLISLLVYKYVSIVPEIEEQISLIAGSAFLALINGILATIIRGFIIWYAEIKVKAALEKKNLQTELSLLKARLNPHFLFNTLNNIDILIEKDAQAASMYLQKLSDMLRFMLYETTLEQILLDKELDYIKKYIELQKIRTLNDQYIKLDITGNANGLTIAPMLLIPFIENAFKHVANKKIKDAICIQLAISEKEINFVCSTVFDSNKSASEDKSGLGLSLIRQRLELLYKDQYQLKIQSREDIFSVNCVIRLNRNELYHN